MSLKNIIIFLIEEYVKIRKELFLELDVLEKTQKKENLNVDHDAQGNIEIQQEPEDFPNIHS